MSLSRRLIQTGAQLDRQTGTLQERSYMAQGQDLQEVSDTGDRIYKRLVKRDMIYKRPVTREIGSTRRQLQGG